MCMFVCLCGDQRTFHENWFSLSLFTMWDPGIELCKA